MDNQKNQASRDWAKFLDPETLQGNLIAASIFLAAYEILCASIIDRIRDFFTTGFDENGLTVSESYQNKVLSLNRSRLRASLLWLKEASAISDTDIELVDAIRKHKNELAHDLPKFIATADAEINIRLLGSIYDLITKIDRWWIREVEIPTNPELDGQEVNDDDIQSGNMLFLQIMIRTVSDEDFSAAWSELQKQSG